MTLYLYFQFFIIKTLHTTKKSPRNSPRNSGGTMPNCPSIKHHIPEIRPLILLMILQGINIGTVD